MKQPSFLLQITHQIFVADNSHWILGFLFKFDFLWLDPLYHFPEIAAAVFKMLGTSKYLSHPILHYLSSLFLLWSQEVLVSLQYLGTVWIFLREDYVD